ncbi:hypothetical protein JL720_8204 [Aureococcus anophagefferens]|nr:hypothetical protein JL720_8204 [Aureococcus anophagefferens]
MVVFEDTAGNGPLFFGPAPEHFFEVQVVRDSPSWVAENEMPLVREFELIEEREYASTSAAPARADRGRADARAVRIAPYDEASS